MIKKLSCCVFVASLILFLFGCTAKTVQQSESVEETNLSIKQSQLEQSTLIVPTIPSRSELIGHEKQLTRHTPYERHYNWNYVIQSMVSKMLCSSRISFGTILLVDKINNLTNGFLNTNEATETLRNMLISNGKFTLVSIKKLVLAKQQLGLLPQDSLGSRSKTIGIARKVGAHYVLYSNTTGNINVPTLQMQLIKVQTGEIIWSDKVIIPV